MNELRAEWHQESQAILKWWATHMVDVEEGGFYGFRDAKGKLNAEADKSIILNSRILWTFSEAALYFGEDVYKEVAERAYHYLLANFIDQDHGGVFWMLTYRGEAIDDKKQVYAQAFTIYALSTYYLLTKDASSLELALGLFELLEIHSMDSENGGYLEAFSREWRLLEDLRLSEKDQNETKTMNTHLHVLEAYSTLWKALKESGLDTVEKDQVKRALEKLILLFQEKFINEEGHLHLFFDEYWELKSRVVSFGHDIEAAWLLWEAAENLEDHELLIRLKPDVLKLIHATEARGVAEDGSIWNEVHENGSLDANRHWWPQAEGMVGFYLGYQLTGERKYLEKVKALWEFIQQYHIDQEGGEWHWMLNDKLEPVLSEYKAGPWKAPYHNVRALIELLRRSA